MIQYQEMAQFVKNNQGTENMVDSDGYIYNKKKSNSTRTFWGCKDTKKFQCRGSASTEGYMICSRSGHTHAPFELRK